MSSVHGSQSSLASGGLSLASNQAPLILAPTVACVPRERSDQPLRASGRTDPRSLAGPSERSRVGGAKAIAVLRRSPSLALKSATSASAAAAIRLASDGGEGWCARKERRRDAEPNGASGSARRAVASGALSSTSNDVRLIAAPAVACVPGERAGGPSRASGCGDLRSLAGPSERSRVRGGNPIAVFRNSPPRRLACEKRTSAAPTIRLGSGGGEARSAQKGRRRASGIAERPAPSIVGGTMAAAPAVFGSGLA